MNKRDFSQGEKLGYRDHLITLTQPKVGPSWMSEEQYAVAPKALVIRELDVGGKLLITTLTGQHSQTGAQSLIPIALAGGAGYS